MRTIELIRNTDDGKQTLGTIEFTKINGDLFRLFTLELPWKENQNDVSCIPDSTPDIPFYTCKYTRSNRLSVKAGHDVFTYEVLGVPGRAGIRIHSANEWFQLLGCIAPGSALMDINNDHELDVINSRGTLELFEKEMQFSDFNLIIKRAA